MRITNQCPLRKRVDNHVLPSYQRRGTVGLELMQSCRMKSEGMTELQREALDPLEKPRQAGLSISAYARTHGIPGSGSTIGSFAYRSEHDLRAHLKLPVFQLLNPLFGTRRSSARFIRCY